MSGAEEVILLADDGRHIGTMSKSEVHGHDTPLHLAFSFYGFTGDGDFLETRRSRDKPVFPGVRTNTCCGHPAPGERFEEAITRRVRYELGLVATEIRLALPRFRYRAEMGGVVENEICPVFVGRVRGTPQIDPSEVDSVRKTKWSAFVERISNPASRGEFSPWAVLQVDAMVGLPLLNEYCGARMREGDGQ